MIPAFFNPFAIFFARLGIAQRVRREPIGRIRHGRVIYCNFKLFYFFAKNQVTFFDIDVT